MKLIITQPEIEEIVRAHVLATVSLRDNADVKIDFTATRGEDGIVATIDIPYMGVAGIPAIAAATAAADSIPTPTRRRKASQSAQDAAGESASSSSDSDVDAAPTAGQEPEQVDDGGGEVETQADRESVEDKPPVAKAPSLFASSFLAR